MRSDLLEIEQAIRRHRMAWERRQRDMILAHIETGIALVGAIVHVYDARQEMAPDDLVRVLTELVRSRSHLLAEVA